MKTLAEFIIETLQKQGVKRIFGVPGGGSSLALIDSADGSGIEFVVCKTETSAALMAAVTGELTGSPGVVLTGIGPGAASVVNGVAYASLEKSPLIVITDAHHSADVVPPHQAFDQSALFAPISKAQASLKPENGAQVFSELFALAAAEPPGPVHIDLSTKAATTELVSTDLHTPQNPSVATVELSARTRKLISGAQRPVLIIGHQSRPAIRASAVNQLAEVLRGPTLTTYKGKGVIGDSNPLYVGLFTGARLDNVALDGADLIIFCGVDPVELFPGPWLQSTPVLVISETSEMGWPFDPAETIVGPIEKTTSLVAAVFDRSEWGLERIAEVKSQILFSLSNRGSEGYYPDDVIELAARSAPDGSRATVDAGAHMFSAMARWPAKTPFGVLKSNGLSTMGFAVPAAIASCLEQPEFHCTAFIGDGGLMMCLGELATAVRLKLNMTIVVLNDAALSLIDIKQRSQNRPNVGVRYPKSNFATVAKGLGCQSWKVEANDDLEAAMKEAYSTPGVTLVDVTVNPSGYANQLKSLRG